MTINNSTAPLGGTTNMRWASDKSRFGFKMLAKMGWSEGKGLGKHEDGMSTHVKATIRTESLGLGFQADHAGQAAWGETSKSFGDILAELNASYGGTAKEDKKKSKKNKKEKKSKKSKAISDDEASASRAKRLSYKKFLNNKNVKKYNSSDLAAILGNAASRGITDSEVSDEQAFTMSEARSKTSNDESRKRKKAEEIDTKTANAFERPKKSKKEKTRKIA